MVGGFVPPAICCAISIVPPELAIVQEHIAAEKAHDISRTIATFHHPRYELAPFCSVSDGNQAVHDPLAARTLCRSAAYWTAYGGATDWDLQFRR